MWTTLHNEERNEAQLIETIYKFYLYQQLLEGIGSPSIDNSSVTDLVLTNEVMRVSCSLR